jgi:hypothetical protein
MRVGAGLGVERVGQPVAVVAVSPKQVRREHQQERHGVAGDEPPFTAAPRVVQHERPRHRARDRAIGPRQRREHAEEAEQPRRARALQRQAGAQHRGDQQHEQRRLQPRRRQRRGVVDRGVADRGDRDERAPAGRPPRHRRQQQHDAAVAGDAPGARPRRQRAVGHPERHREREQHRPTEVGVALDRRFGRIEVEHEAVALGEVLRIAERDERVVARPAQRPRLRRRGQDREGGEDPEDGAAVHRGRCRPRAAGALVTSARRSRR